MKFIVKKDERLIYINIYTFVCYFFIFLFLLHCQFILKDVFYVIFIKSIP